MKYQIIGDSDCPLVQVQLGINESIQCERGSMVYLSNVNLEGSMNSRKKGIGGVLGAIGRSMTSGESMFITTATGTAPNGVIGLAPQIPGKIMCLKLDPAHQYRLNTSVYLASDPGVQYVMKKQDFGKALFAGTGGFFVMETKGIGDLLVSSFGDLMPLQVTSDSPIRVDNEHVVAWDASLDYNIQIASGTFGFTTGEGLVNEFHGNGTVWIQTRNIHNLADALRPFLPTSNG